MTPEVLEKVLRMLERQTFADWYNSGRFDTYITGGENVPSRDEILKDLSNMLER